MRVKYDGKTVEENSEKAKIAEGIVKTLLEQIIKGKHFEAVHDVEEFWHKGDIRCIENGRFYEVKDDGVIHRSGNVYCEVYKWFFDHPNVRKNGFMLDGQYERFCVLDQISCKLYILHFDRLKAIYKDYKMVDSQLEDCDTKGTIVPLDVCRQRKILLYETEYYYDECFDDYYIGKKPDAIL